MCLKCYLKTVKFIKLCQIASKTLKKNDCSTIFALKSLNFAQILENLAEMCVCTSLAFKALVVGATIHIDQEIIFLWIEIDQRVPT